MTGELDRAASAAVPADRPLRRRSPYRRRFLLAYVILAGLALGAGAAWLRYGRTDAPRAVAGAPASAAANDGWSDFHASGRGLARAQSIADHVAPRYRNLNGTPLVAVEAAPPRLQSVPLSAIVVVKDAANGMARGSYDVVPPDGTLQYYLCGLGKLCSIQTGTPSNERGALLRRESLELALSSFHELPDVDAVVVFMPPHPAAATPTEALFFRRSESAGVLRLPRREVVPDGPLRSQDLPDPAGDPIDSFARERQFGFHYQKVQDGSPILVLDPTPIGP